MAYYPQFNPNLGFMDRLGAWQEQEQKNKLMEAQRKMQELKYLQEPARHKGEMELNDVYKKLYGAQAEDIPKRTQIAQEKLNIEKLVNSPAQLSAKMQLNLANAALAGERAKYYGAEHELKQRGMNVSEKSLALREKESTPEWLNAKLDFLKRKAKRYGSSFMGRILMDKEEEQEKRDKAMYDQAVAQAQQLGIVPPSEAQQMPVNAPAPAALPVQPSRAQALPGALPQQQQNPLIAALVGEINKRIPKQLQQNVGVPQNVPPGTANIPTGRLAATEIPGTPLPNMQEAQKITDEDVRNETPIQHTDNLLKDARWAAQPVVASNGEKFQIRNTSEDVAKEKGFENIKSEKDINKIAKESIKRMENNIKAYEMAEVKAKAAPGFMRRGLAAMLLKYTLAQIPVDSVVKYTGKVGQARLASDKFLAEYFNVYNPDYSKLQIFKKVIGPWAAENARIFGGGSVHVKNMEKLERMVGGDLAQTNERMFRDHIEAMTNMFKYEGVMERSAIHEPSAFAVKQKFPKEVKESIWGSDHNVNKSKMISLIMKEHGMNKKDAEAFYNARLADENAMLAAEEEEHENEENY